MPAPAAGIRCWDLTKRPSISVAEAGEALGLGLALRLALGLALLVAGLLVLLVVLEADDPDLPAQRAVAPERGELIAAGRAVVARPAVAPAVPATTAATAGPVLAGRRGDGLDGADRSGGEPHPGLEDRVAGLEALGALAADGRPLHGLPVLAPRRRERLADDLRAAHALDGGDQTGLDARGALRLVDGLRLGGRGGGRVGCLGRGRGGRLGGGRGGVGGGRVGVGGGRAGVGGGRGRRRPFGRSGRLGRRRGSRRRDGSGVALADLGQPRVEGAPVPLGGGGAGPLGPRRPAVRRAAPGGLARGTLGGTGLTLGGNRRGGALGRSGLGGGGGLGGRGRRRARFGGRQARCGRNGLRLARSGLRLRGGRRLGRGGRDRRSFRFRRGSLGGGRRGGRRGCGRRSFCRRGGGRGGARRLGWSGFGLRGGSLGGGREVGRGGCGRRSFCLRRGSFRGGRRLGWGGRGRRSF